MFSTVKLHTRLVATFLCCALLTFAQAAAQPRDAMRVPLAEPQLSTGESANVTLENCLFETSSSSSHARALTASHLRSSAELSAIMGTFC